jgi:hypothetical protein
MKSSFFLLLRSVNGVYLFAYLLWLIYLFAFEETNLRGFVLLSLFLAATELFFFMFVLVFYFIARDFSVRQQIIYCTSIAIVLSDVYLLIVTPDLFKNPYSVLAVLFNVFGILYLKFFRGFSDNSESC